MNFENGFILNETLLDEKNTIDKPLANLIKKSGKSLTKIETKKAIITYRKESN